MLLLFLYAMLSPMPDDNDNLGIPTSQEISDLARRYVSNRAGGVKMFNRAVPIEIMEAVKGFIKTQGA